MLSLTVYLNLLLILRSEPPLSTTIPEGKNLHMFMSLMCPLRVRYIENSLE